MLRLLSYLISKGVCTADVIPELLSEEVVGMPGISSAACSSGCDACIEECPTDAITKTASGASVVIDRGCCITCQNCVVSCPSGTIVNDRSTSVWSYNRRGLVVSTDPAAVQQRNLSMLAAQSRGIFRKSLSIRVVSTGCSCCDLEISAAGNPIFDMERFGVNIVASPRHADALLVTGPVPKAMHEALLSCYKAMAEPKIVIACGTCAISGGVHSHGYAEANGVSSILPVDVFIPGCPPHPWQLIRGILAARKVPGRQTIAAQEQGASQPLQQNEAVLKGTGKQPGK